MILSKKILESLARKIGVISRDVEIDKYIEVLNIQKYIHPDYPPSVLWKVDVYFITFVISFVLFILFFIIIAKLINANFFLKLLLVLPSPLIFHNIIYKIFRDSLKNKYFELINNLEKEAGRFLQVLLLFLTTEKIEIALKKTLDGLKDSLKTTYSFYYPIVTSTLEVSNMIANLYRKTPEEAKSYYLIFQKLLESKELGGDVYKNLLNIEPEVIESISLKRKNIIESLESRKGFVGVIVGMIFLIDSIFPLIYLVRPNFMMLFIYVALFAVITPIFYTLFTKKIIELLEIS